MKISFYLTEKEKNCNISHVGNDQRLQKTYCAKRLYKKNCSVLNYRK